MRKTMLSIVLMLAAVSARAGTYAIGPGVTTDTVYFRSQAKLEFIEGKTTNINGNFTCDPTATTPVVAGTFQVDLRTLRTGIEMRDQHMRERHLQTDKYPMAYFHIDSVSGLPATVDTGKTYALSGNGWFYIHGCKRIIPLTLEITRHLTKESTDGLNVRARFDINLDQFGIPRPKAVFLKLAETIEVEVILTAVNNLSSVVITLPDWPERK